MNHSPGTLPVRRPIAGMGRWGTRTRRRVWASAAGLLAVIAAGCKSPDIFPQLAYVPSSPIYSDEFWRAVLTRHVRDGLVDYDSLSRDREALDRYYALVSVTGPDSTPEQFPTTAHRMAYWINAYNTLVLVAVLQRYPISTMYDLTLPDLEHEYTFILDGRKTTLADIQERILGAGNRDVRALFALCGAAMATPRLADRPYHPAELDDQLDRATRQALDDPGICQIDHQTRQIRLWQKILRHSDDFVAYWKIRRRSQTAYLYNVLLDLASEQRRQALQSAVGYEFAALPFDRTLNRYGGPLLQEATASTGWTPAAAAP